MLESKPGRLSVMILCSMGWLSAGSSYAQNAETSPFGTLPPQEEVAADTSSQDSTDANWEEGEELPDGQAVKVGSFGQIDLHVKELDITKVMQLLSIQAQRNIVATRSVSGSVSADLYQVDFYDALDAILHPNGYGYEEKGNFIYVYTTEELEKIKLANEKPVAILHHLNYITAEDASAFVQPLLSAAGSLSVSGRPAAGIQPTVSSAGENQNAHGERMLIRDHQDNVDEILAVLKELDTRPKQVMVEATILEARLTDATGFGVDINAVINLEDALFPTPLGVVDDLIDGIGPSRGDQGQAVQTSVGNTDTGPAGMKVGFLSNNVSVFIRALDSVTDTNVIAKPKLLALNRMPADLLVGQRLGYISTTATESSTTQTVEFLEVGTQLSFRAFISDDDYVRLELRPAISDGSVALVGDFVIPTETSNELTTNVIVRSGQTIVLGGLFKEDTDKSRSQVPGLGDVPLLGNAFKGRDDTFERSEVIFLITPTIVKDEALALAGDRAADSVERKRVGAKDGLLPWAREKQVTNYMHRAMAARKKGDNDKALWNVNMALTLEPANVDAMRLKEELTGQHFHMGDPSMLQDAVNQMVTDQIGTEEADETVEADTDEAADSLTATFEAALNGEEQATETTEVEAFEAEAVVNVETDPSDAQWQELAEDFADEADTFEAPAETTEDVTPLEEAEGEWAGEEQSDATESPADEPVDVLDVLDQIEDAQQAEHDAPSDDETAEDFEPQDDSQSAGVDTDQPEIETGE